MTTRRRPKPSGLHYLIGSGATYATVAQVGAGLGRFVVDDREVVDGYDEDQMASAGRGQLLVPWPNRVDHGRYEWDGTAHQLPIDEPDRSTAIHGLVRWAGWSLADRDDDTVTLTHTLWPSPGYPFQLGLRMTYRVGNGALTVTTTVENQGSDTAPVGIGQHPYLAPSPGTHLDDCTLTVPASQRLVTDDRGLPTGERPVADSAFDFRSGKRIGSTVLDTTFRDLARDDEGVAVVRFTDPSGACTEMWMDAGHRAVQVFTGDTLPAARRRTGLAVEPMTCPPNALVTGQDLIRLEPGASTTSQWGLRVATNEETT